MFTHGPKLQSSRCVFCHCPRCRQLTPCQSTHLRTTAPASERLPQSSAHNSQLSFLTAPKRHYQKSHRDSHKSQSVLTSFIYSLPSKHIQDDSEKTRLKYLKLLKVITIWKETKFWMLDLPLTNFLSSFFHTHTHVLSGDYTVRTHSPTNHSTASAKITISSCVHHLLVWTMSITN